MTIPINEVRSYITARYDARFEIPPCVFENVVADVFADFGFTASVTALTGDGRIDVVLESPDKVTGIQVKRWRAIIEVEQIRAFAGALLLGGFVSGVLVTTSMFRRGATPAARLAAMRGLEIKLVDAPRFYDALRRVQRQSFEIEELLRPPFSDAALRLLGYRNETGDDFYRPDGG